MDLQTLKVPLIADISKFMKSIDTASSKASGLTNQFSKVGGAVVKGGLIAGAATIGIAGAAIVSFTKDAIPLEGVRNAFNGMTDDMEGGSAKILSAMKKGSNGMVSQADLMETYNNAALGVSTTFANELPDAMGYLSKIALATGQDVNKMQADYVTGIARMSPKILDNMGIQVDMNKANEDYAKLVGKTVGALTAEEKQMALNNQVLDLFEQKTKDMPDATGTAIEAQAQFTASLQDTKDMIGTAFLPAIEKIQIMFGDLLSDPAVQQRIEDITTAIANFAIKVVEKIPEIIAWFEKLPEWFEANRPIIIGVLAVLGIAVMAFAITSAYAGIMAIIPWLPFIAVFFLIAAAVAFVVAVIEDDFGGIRTWLVGAIEDIVNWFQKLWEKLKKVADYIKTKVVGAFNGVKKAIQWVIDKVESLIGWFKKIKIPTQFLGHSPSPFEMSLRGINEQLDLAGKKLLPKYSAELNMASKMSFDKDNINANNDKLISAIKENKELFDYDKLARVFRDVVLREMV